MSFLSSDANASANAPSTHAAACTSERWPGPLPHHGRYDDDPLPDRPEGDWPGGSRLAVYLGFNLEHFAFGVGEGARLGPPSAEPDVLNYAWRDYGNRVGAWRCLDLFDDLALPTGAIVNTALLDHAPALIEAVRARGDELIGHGHTNAERQGGLDEAGEQALLARCRERLAKADDGNPPTGWLSPWISESPVTPDLLVETGYRYTLNWCHDDQPTWLRTRSGRPLLAIPYPQELNDIPMIITRQLDAKDFAAMIVDNLDEMLGQAGRHRQRLVMGIALHPYIVGQPYRLRHLRRALEHVARRRDAGEVWMTTPGAIARQVSTATDAA